MMVAIVIPVYNITAVVILELFRGGKVPVFVLIKNILKNPMIRGALMGFIFHMLGIKLPLSVEGPIKQFANLTTPLALFVLGGTAAFQCDRRQSEICGSVDDRQDGDPAGSDSGGCDAAPAFPV